MIILHQPDSAPLAENPAALPRDDGGPIFAEPWQAEAFALAVRLSAQGHFTWKEWASTLARLSDPATLLARKKAWAEAYRRTPHGKPVELEGDSAS
jgi:nitrile hydratase accessory protein